MRFLNLYSLIFTLVIAGLGGGIAYASSQEPELLCLATAIYHESRGESIEGQLAVAHTVLNRTKSGEFPDQICAVVYQPRQFTDVQECRPNFSGEQWTTALKVATLAKLNVTKDPSKGAKWYYAHNKIPRPPWARDFKVVAQIGNHTFLDE